jgi:hypothetical protein
MDGPVGRFYGSHWWLDLPAQLAYRSGVADSIRAQYSSCTFCPVFGNVYPYKHSHVQEMLRRRLPTLVWINMFHHVDAITAMLYIAEPCGTMPTRTKPNKSKSKRTRARISAEQHANDCNVEG